MSFCFHDSTPRPSQQQLHQGIVIKYSGTTCIASQKSSVLLNTLNTNMSPDLTKQLERIGTVIAHKVVDLSLCSDAVYALLPTGQRLKLTMASPEDQTATSLFTITPIEDFIAKPYSAFTGPEYLVCQTRVIIVYNALVKSLNQSTNISTTHVYNFTDSEAYKHPSPHVALIFSNPQFLKINRLLLDGTYKITNCAFDDTTVVLSLLSGHILFIDRTQIFQKNNVVDPSNYSYYGLTSYSSLAAQLLKDYQTIFPGNFSFREAIRLLSISPSKHIPFFAFHGCDLVLAMPLGCIFIFTRNRCQDSGSNRLILSHATVALPFVRHDLPNKSFKITHYAASRVSFLLPVNNTMLIIGYENSILQYYSWDVDGIAHPLDGIDLSAGKITHIHAGLILSPECNDQMPTPTTQQIHTAPTKVLIVATIGSTLFFIVQCFPKMTVIATVPAPERFVDCGKIYSPNSQQFSSTLIYTAIDGSVKYTHFPSGYLFRSGVYESNEIAQHHEQQTKTIQRITTLLKNVTYNYESDESASELNMLNDRSKAAIPTFLLSSSENEESHHSVDDPILPRKSILDITNVHNKTSVLSHHTKRPWKLTSINTHSTLTNPLNYNDAFSPTDNTQPKIILPIESFSVSPFASDKAMLSHGSDKKLLSCRPFEQINVTLDNKPLSVQIQEMYSLLGTIHRRKLEAQEQVFYDDTALERLKIVNNAHDLIRKTALMTKKITISEYQKSISAAINIKKLLKSPQNLKRATELLIKNDYIFRSSRTKISPHIRNAYLHLKHTDKISKKEKRNSSNFFSLSRHFTNKITGQLSSSTSIGPLSTTVLSNPQNSMLLRAQENKQNMHNPFGITSLPTYKKSHVFQYIPTLARDLMFNGNSSPLIDPEYVPQNVWSPSPKLSQKPNNLTNIIMRSRDRRLDMLTHGHTNNLIGVIRSKVLEMPKEKALGEIKHRGKEKERPKVFFSKYEHIKVIDKELLKDLQRFKALKIGRDLGTRIIRENDVLSALLTGKNANENLRDIIDLTNPNNHDYTSIEDIITIGKNVINILDPDYDYPYESVPGSRLISSRNKLKFNNTLDYEDYNQEDCAGIPRIITPRDEEFESLRQDRSRSAARHKNFGFDLMNQLLRNFDYRLNRRRVRSGINGAIAISDDYTRTILLRRSASLPTIETINNVRTELATKLDSALGHEFGISRWDNEANRSYMTRILSIDRLSDPESSIWNSDDTIWSLDSSTSHDLDDNIVSIPSLNVPNETLSTTRKCLSVAASRRIEMLLNKEYLSRRAYSAKQSAEAAQLNLDPLDLRLYLNNVPVLDKEGSTICLNNDKVTIQQESICSDDINELDPESQTDDEIVRLDSAFESMCSSTSSSSIVSDESIECKPSIFGSKGNFDPSQYVVSSTYLPDILLRAALQDLKRQTTVITTEKRSVSLLRDDCSQVFKAIHKPSYTIHTENCNNPTRYGFNPLFRYCMQNRMFCPREHLEFSNIINRDIRIDTKRRAYSFDRLEPLILGKPKYMQKHTQQRQRQRPDDHSLNTIHNNNDKVFTNSDWSFKDDYDYLTFKPIQNQIKRIKTIEDTINYTDNTNANQLTSQEILSSATHTLLDKDNYINEIKAQAFTTYLEYLALDRIKKNQANSPSAMTEMRNFKKLFTRELYEDWARVYRHNIIRPDTLYDDQFEVTVMKPTFPLYYHVMTNKTAMDGMITNIMNEDVDATESNIRSNLVVTKAQLPFSTVQNQSVESFLDDMQSALGLWPEQQSEENIIPHHYALPPKPPYYNPRIPIIDSYDEFYDPSSIVPLEPLLPEGEGGIRLQIGLFTPYAFCLKNPSFVDNEKLTTILNPVAYTNCNDVILSSTHCEQPHSFLSKHLKDAEYPLVDQAESDQLNSQEIGVRQNYKTSFDAKVAEFTASFFSLHKAKSADLPLYHNNLYAHTVYPLPSYTENFAPKVRCSMITVGQAVKAVFTKYFQSFTPVQRKIIAQTTARGVVIDYNRLNYVPYSFLQLLLLYSSALSVFQLLKGQRCISKRLKSAGNQDQLPISRQLQYILDTQFPVEPIQSSKIKNKKDTYGRISSAIYTELFFKFYSIQDVLNHKCEIFVRYLLILISYVQLCNMESCISKFVDYQLRRVLKQDAYVQELSDPYKDVIRVYERMETYVCTVRSLQKVEEFSCLYEKCLQESVFKTILNKVSKDQPFSLLTYFGPRSDPKTIYHMLTGETNAHIELPPLRSTTLAVVYNDSDLNIEVLKSILSKYAISYMLDDTKMHINGVYAALRNHFLQSTRKSSNENDQYFSGFITNLTVIPLSVLFLIRRLEEIESLVMSRTQKSIICRKLHILLLDAYLRAFTLHKIQSLAVFAPLVYLYVHIFRIPKSSNYQDYATMLHQRQRTIYKILYDASLHELCMRVHNNYVIQQPDITSVIGISKSDMLSNFFSTHFYPAYVAGYARSISCHKVIIGKGIYSEADDDNNNNSSQLDISINSIPNKIYSESQDKASEPPLNFSWYSSLYKAVTKNPLTEPVQQAYKNRYSYDMHEDHVSLLEKSVHSSYKGDSQFRALVLTNKFDDIRQNIEERKLSIEKGSISGEPVVLQNDQLGDDLPSLGRSIFRNRILTTLMNKILDPVQTNHDNNSIIENSSAEELCISESFADSVQTGERILVNTTVQLLKTRNLANNVSKWAEVAAEEESNLEHSCIAYPTDVEAQTLSRASFDSTYELRKAFTDIRVPKYRTSSVLGRTNARRIGISITKPLPSIPTDIDHTFSSTKDVKSPVKSISNTSIN